MAKHRRYSRKRGQRRNRRASRKMKGGVGQEDVVTLEQLRFNPVQIEYLLQNHPDMDIVFLQNSVNGVPGSQFFSIPQTPDQIITTLQAIDADTDNVDDSLNTTREAISIFSISNNSLNNSSFTEPSYSEQESIITPVDGDQPFDTDISVIPEEDINELDMSFDSDIISSGGKQRTLAKQNKRKTNKRKTRKSKKTRKTRKNRKRGHRGGKGFTTSITTNPIEYKEDEYDQMKNLLNYDPTKQ